MCTAGAALLGEQLPVVAVADFAGQTADELIRRIFVQRVTRTEFRKTPAQRDIDEAVAGRRRVGFCQIKVVQNTLRLRRQERVVRIDNKRKEERPGWCNNGIDLVVGERTANIRTDALVNVEVGNDGTGPFLLRCLQQVERVEVEVLGRIDEIATTVTGKLDKAVTTRVDTGEVTDDGTPGCRQRTRPAATGRSGKKASSHDRPGLTLPDRCSQC